MFFQKYLIYIAGGAVIILLIAVGVLTLSRNSLQNKLADSIKLSNQLEERVRAGDALIEDYMQKTKLQADRLQEAVQQAEEERAEAAARLQELASRPIPEQPDKQIEYLYKVGEELNQQWEGQK